jgi:hypothetical protein
MKKVILGVLMLFSVALYAGITDKGADDASNYSNWTDESNEGTGFGAWDLWVSGTSGWFLGSSAGDGFGDIDVSGKSFGMWGNPSGDN